MANIHLTRDDVIYSDVNPIGNEIPDFIGQICITGDDKVFFANGLTNINWIESSTDIDLSAYATNTRVEEIGDKVQSNEASILSLQEELNGSRVKGINAINSLLSKL